MMIIDDPNPYLLMHLQKYSIYNKYKARKAYNPIRKNKGSERRQQLIIIHMQMWGIQLNKPQTPILPLLTSQSFILLVAVLLGVRISLQYMLQNNFNVKIIRKQHNSNALQFSYFYHLSIVILALSQINWNLFDLWVWVVSYVCVGMLRKTIFTINVERDIMINGYGYNNQIVKLLTNSLLLGAVSFAFSLLYIVAIHLSFLGVMYKVISMLCFPSLMLAVDSLHLFLTSRQTQKHLVYFYNQNINGISPVYKIDLYHKIIGYAIKCSHYFNLALLCSSIIMKKIDFLDCLWIVSVSGAFIQSSTGMLKTVSKYRYMKRFMKGINRILMKVKRASDQVCIICMEPLLNSHRLIQCGHLFHYKCLFLWIQTKQQCPVCRVRINLNL